MIEKTREIISRLEKEYGSPRHNNKYNPLNEFLYIMLSTKTTFQSFKRTYNIFKKKYPRWPEIINVEEKDIEGCIKNGGLAKTKSKQILAVVKKLKNDFGRVTLSPLKKFDDRQAEKYLTSLPGVGLKSAKCIMMYSFGRNVLPVDTHTFRISNRLGLINGIAKDKHKLCLQIEEAIPKEKRYIYHVTCISHGRKICKDNNPICEACILRDMCYYFNNKGSHFDN